LASIIDSYTIVRDFRELAELPSGAGSLVAVLMGVKPCSGRERALGQSMQGMKSGERRFADEGRPGAEVMGTEAVYGL
jgi:hypothetical protein